MKKLLTLALILISMGVSAQYHKKPIKRESYSINNPLPNSEWKTPQLYIPASILVGTFVYVETANVDIETRNMIAITGMLTSVTSYLILKKINSKKCYNKKYKYIHNY